MLVIAHEEQRPHYENKSDLNCPRSQDELSWGTIKVKLTQTGINDTMCKPPILHSVQLTLFV